jgi:hypothetical protein
MHAPLPGMFVRYKRVLHLDSCEGIIMASSQYRSSVLHAAALGGCRRQRGAAHGSCAAPTACTRHQLHAAAACAGGACMVTDTATADGFFR